MSVSLCPILNGFQCFTQNGLPNNGGFIYTYAAGTTTPTATYTTNSGSIPNSNPIVLGIDGRPPQEIWITDGTAYKFVICDNTNTPIGSATYDNISAIQGTLSSTYVLQNSGTSSNQTLSSPIINGSCALTYSLPPGENNNNAASTAFVASGLLGGAGVSNGYSIVTSTRAPATVYTTGIYPLIVCILFTTFAAGDTAELQVESYAVSKYANTGTTSGQLTLTAVVPPGSGYQLLLTGSAAMTAWFEF